MALIVAAVALLTTLPTAFAGTCLCSCCKGVGCDPNGVLASTDVAHGYSYDACSVALCSTQFPWCPDNPELGTTEAAWSAFPVWAIIAIAVGSLIALLLGLVLLSWCCCYSLFECICCCCCPSSCRRQHVVLASPPDVSAAHVAPGAGKLPYDVSVFNIAGPAGETAGKDVCPYGYTASHAAQPAPPVVLGGSYPGNYPPGQPPQPAYVARDPHLV